MRAILMSIKPQHVANILNELKTLEIRKRFPSDYVGWVYIYCTKDGYLSENGLDPYYKYFAIRHKPRFTPNYMRGKVVARFWCDKVDNYVNGSKIAFENGTYIFGTNDDFETILKPSCLTEDELYDYCEDLSFKAIHITKLEIFDRPKEISGFYAYSDKKLKLNYHQEARWLTSLTRAPQSWCYVEA